MTTMYKSFNTEKIDPLHGSLEVKFISLLFLNLYFL